MMYNLSVKNKNMSKLDQQHRRTEKEKNTPSEKKPGIISDSLSKTTNAGTELAEQLKLSGKKATKELKEMKEETEKRNNEIIFGSKEWNTFVANKGRLPTTIGNYKGSPRPEGIDRFLTKKFGKTALILVTEESCKPCKILEPFLAEYRNRTGLNVGVVDFQIVYTRSTPYVLFYKHGKPVKARIFEVHHKGRTVVDKDGHEAYALDIKKSQDAIDKDLDDFIGYWQHKR